MSVKKGLASGCICGGNQQSRSNKGGYGDSTITHSNHEQGEEIGPGHNFGSAGGHFGKALWETNVGNTMA